MKFKNTLLAAVICMAAMIESLSYAQPLGSLPNSFQQYSNAFSYYNIAGTLTAKTNTVAGLTNMIPKNATTTTPDLFSVWWNPYATNGAWVRGTNAGIIPLSKQGQYLSIDAQFEVVGTATNSTLTFARSAAVDGLASSCETAGTISWGLAIKPDGAGIYTFHTNYSVGGDGQWILQSWTVNNCASGYVTNPIIRWRIEP